MGRAPRHMASGRRHPAAECSLQRGEGGVSRQRGCGAPAGPPASARGLRRRPVIPQGSRPRAAGRPEGARVAHADQAMRQAGSSARELGPAVSRPCPPHPVKNTLQKGGRNGERRLPAGPRLHPVPHTPLQPLVPAALPRSRPAGLGCSGPQLCATLSPARRTSHLGRDDLYPDAESTCRRARPGADASALFASCGAGAARPDRQACRRPAHPAPRRARTDPSPPRARPQRSPPGPRPTCPPRRSCSPARSSA